MVAMCGTILIIIIIFVTVDFRHTATNCMCIRTVSSSHPCPPKNCGGLKWGRKRKINEKGERYNRPTSFLSLDRAAIYRNGKCGGWRNATTPTSTVFWLPFYKKLYFVVVANTPAYDPPPSFSLSPWPHFLHRPLGKWMDEEHNPIFGPSSS